MVLLNQSILHCPYVSGVLVEAMRKGHWIILDELNLAPTDVLEALNRVNGLAISTFYAPGMEFGGI